MVKLPNIKGLKRLEEIGEGSFGNVYKAKWNGEDVAAKQLKKRVYFQERFAERFSAECMTLRGLDHKNIVKMIDVIPGDNEVPPILITELLHCDLEKYIKDQTSIPLKDVVNMMLDVAEGLQYLHNRRLPIAHRDLASKNVLLTKDRTAKIADLGLARVFVSAGIASADVGTPLYAAPETFCHKAADSGQFVKPEYDVGVDVFSFGVLLLEVINCRTPRPDPRGSPVTETGELIPEHKRRREDISKMGKEHCLASLVLRCLENDKKGRPIAREIVDELKEQKENIDRKVKIASSGRAKLKIVALGGVNAGKTCILERFVNSKFNYAMVIPTIGSSIYTTTITHNGITLCLQMDDTAGQERFKSIPPQLLREADAALLVFDISRRKSFAEIPSYIQMIASHSRFEVSMILVGSKVDMSESRKVSKEEAQAFAKTHAMPYIETSAKTDENIERTFELAVQMIYNRLDLSDIELYVPLKNADSPNETSGCSCC